MTSIHNEKNVTFAINKEAFIDSKTKAPTNNVASAIEMFGGKGKKSLIQQQKEKLEEKWAAERAIKMVKKSKWKVGGSGYGSGVYKKRVVLDFQNKDDQQKVDGADAKKRFELA
ncbi:expressed unknown protein [Seminavis robusta]|uniref:Uncharacterized protein n=1 Tax=Seminavis robusta TaxID=568900 RepID=A0A9N8DZY3_9STRA|nr:expressed unknown protein [Seminavis robusta]|eukprot:Sro426_g140520.1 n/a (114) ;mRNA; f:58520-58861